MCGAVRVFKQLQNAGQYDSNVSASMRVTVTDTKLRRHSVDVDESASVAHLKRLLADMPLVPAGFVPNLVFQKRILGDDDSLAGIGYSCDRCISLVCVRSAAEGAAAQASQELSAPIKFNATPPEVAMVHFRDSFLHVQPHLTRCMKQIFERKFGASNWLSRYQSFLSPSMRSFAVDDGRDFDMCGFLCYCVQILTNCVISAFFALSAHVLCFMLMTDTCSL
jgi:hypothetical protein